MPYPVPFAFDAAPAANAPWGAPQYPAPSYISFYDEQRIFQSVATELNQPALEIQQQQQNLGAQAQQLTQVASALQALGSAAAALQDTQGLLGTTVVSSNPNEVTASAGTQATAGSHQVTVAQLATAQQNLSSTFSSGSSQVLASGQSSGSLSLQVGQSPAATVQVDNTTTLSSLASSINGLGLAVNAEVIAVQGGFALQLSGTNTGAANSITITETNLATNLAQDQTQAAADATGSIDSQAFDSPTNVLGSQIPGVTLNLLATTNNPVTVTVGYQSPNLSGDIIQFVNAYNGVVQAIGPAQNGSVSYQNLLGELAGDIASSSPSAQGQINTLAELGISTGVGGILTVDVGALNQAIATDPHAVATVFANGPYGATQGIADEVAAIASTWGDPVAGTLSQLAAQSSQAAGQLQDSLGDAHYAAATQMGTLHQEMTDLNVAEAQLRAQNLEVGALIPPASAPGSAPGANMPNEFDSYDPFQNLAPYPSAGTPPGERGPVAVGDSNAFGAVP